MRTRHRAIGFSRIAIMLLGGLIAVDGLAACSSHVEDAAPLDHGDAGAPPAANGHAPEEDPGDMGEGPNGAPSVTFRGDRRSAFVPKNDLEFIDFFIVHHEQAVMMMDVELERGSRTDVRETAEEMKKQQSREIAELRAKRMAMTGSGEPTSAPPDPHMDADMAAMRAASGEEVDRLFIVDMIPHHGAGIAPADSAIPNLSDAQLRTMAEDIFSAQSREIGELIAMLGGEPSRLVTATAAADTAVVGDERVPYTPADDVLFIDYFVPHHRDAVAAAKMVIARGSDPEVRAMAEDVVKAQSEEIAMMRAAREELTGTADSPPLPHEMPDPMAELETLSGAELDRAFLHHMIGHHSTALAPAHRSYARLARGDLKNLALEIVAAQSNEIGEMIQMLGM